MTQSKENDIAKMIENLADKISSFLHDNCAEPLDGDETERIGRLLTLELDWRQGNVTQEEYETHLRQIEKI